MPKTTNKSKIPAAQDVAIARNSDIEQVCDILASAFTCDPVMAWMSGHPSIYCHLFRSEAEALYKHHGHIYINRERTGAAMWLPPGISSKPPFHWRILAVSWLLWTTGGMRSLQRGNELNQIFDDHHPSEPHFYLHAIGADYENQGRGIGSALMKAGLKICDEQKMPAYLESSNIKNNPLYERHGFKIIGEQTLPGDGPPIWFMWRDARK